MRLISYIILTALALVAQGGSFRVEKLPEETSAKLNAARSKFENAQNELMQLQIQIRASYGDSSADGKFLSGAGAATTGCFSPVITSVELRGGYALITVTPGRYICGGTWEPR